MTTSNTKKKQGPANDMSNMPITKPKIEIHVSNRKLKQYTMIFLPNTGLRQLNKTSRGGRRSKSKAPMPGQDPAAETETLTNQSAESYKECTFFESKTMPKSNSIGSASNSHGVKERKQLPRQKSEEHHALTSLNVTTSNPSVIIGKITPGYRYILEEKFPRVNKRKRLPDDYEISAENIPVEAVLPALPFGINKYICSNKRRRLQNLINPTNQPPEFEP